MGVVSESFAPCWVPLIRRGRNNNEVGWPRFFLFFIGFLPLSPGEMCVFSITIDFRQMSRRTILFAPFHLALISGQPDGCVID